MDVEIDDMSLYVIIEFAWVKKATVPLFVEMMYYCGL